MAVIDASAILTVEMFATTAVMAEYVSTGITFQVINGGNQGQPASLLLQSPL
jgi:hypothetical protein